MKKSLGYAWKGFKTAFIEERNLKIHVAAAVIVSLLGFYFHITTMEWIALVIVIGLVIALELVNSATENLTDLASKEIHPLAGKAKDMAAAAVLFASVIAVVVGLLIFAKYIR